MFVKQVVLVLVLSATVLVLERTAKKQPTFDDERLDVYRRSILKNIVSMLTSLIQRKQPLAADAIEYEYRDAEYEYNRFTAA